MRSRRCRECDWVRDGFVAGELADEVRLPGLTVQQLVRMRDVTAEVAAGVSPTMDAEAAERQRTANRERLLAEQKRAAPSSPPSW